MDRIRPAVADLGAATGRRQLTIAFVRAHVEVRAAAAAGIDLVSIVVSDRDPGTREATGDRFVASGLPDGRLATTDDLLRAAHDGFQLGGGCCDGAASTRLIERPAAEGRPVDDDRRPPPRGARRVPARWRLLRRRFEHPADRATGRRGDAGGRRDPRARCAAGPRGRAR